jgi:hypothetical protein
MGKSEIERRTHMSRKSNSPVLVSVTGLIGVLGIAWLCDGLMQFLRNQSAVTFTLNYFVFWIFGLVALVLAAAWLLVTWVALIRLPGNFWVSLLYLVCGLFIVFYPALYYSPAYLPLLCCWLPNIAAIQLGPTMYLYSSGGWVAIIGLAGLVLRARKKTAG